MPIYRLVLMSGWLKGFVGMDFIGSVIGWQLIEI
jgi:hypothetical protein